jgi:hypothetical protein
MASRQELRDALGLTKNANARQTENKAIRAYCVGGDDLLDALELVNRLATRLRERGIAGANDAQLALDMLIVVRELMLEFLRSTPIERLHRHD